VNGKKSLRQWAIRLIALRPRESSLTRSPSWATSCTHPGKCRSMERSWQVKAKFPVKSPRPTPRAPLCAANVLRVILRHLGSLDAIDRVVRITGYVNSDPTFTDQHLIINGASQLVRDVFGDAGRHARTALGMAQLPLGASVEVEMILKLR